MQDGDHREDVIVDSKKVKPVAVQSIKTEHNQNSNDCQTGVVTDFPGGGPMMGLMILDCSHWVPGIVS
jgi:hypothetical protein